MQADTKDMKYNTKMIRMTGPEIKPVQCTLRLKLNLYTNIEPGPRP